MNNGAIVNLTLVTMNPSRDVVTDGGIVWEDGEIIYVGPSFKAKQLAKAKNLEIEDGQKKILFPGMVNSHMHLFQNLLKGLGADLDLETWWPSTIKPAAIAFREEHVEAAATAGTMESIRGGATTLVDYMYAHPVKGLSQVTIEAVNKVGARLVYARGFRNTGAAHGFPVELIEKTSDVFDEVLSLKKYYQTKSDMVRFMVAPAAAWAVDVEGLRDTRDFANETGVPITMHMFETDTDNVVCRERYGMKDAITFFEKTNLLGDDLLAVHVVDIGDRELKAFREHNVKVSHNPMANMYLASGVAPVTEMLERNICVSLGTDGAASNNSTDMLETLKMTALLHKVAAKDPTAITANKVLEMATIDGARAIGMENLIGSIEEGKRADFFVFDPDACGKSSPCHSPVATLVYSSGQASIVKVVVDGKTIINDGDFVEFEEREVYRHQSEMARDLAKRAGYPREFLERDWKSFVW